MKLVEDFPDALRHARERAGMTQRQLADLVEINHAQLSRYEGGAAEPRPGVLRRLETCLGRSFRMPGGGVRESSQDDYVKTALRLPPDLHAQIHASARTSGRTFNAELISRLSGSYEQGLDRSTAERLIEALQAYVAKT